MEYRLRAAYFHKKTKSKGTTQQKDPNHGTAMRNPVGTKHCVSTVRAVGNGKRSKPMKTPPRRTQSRDIRPSRLGGGKPPRNSWKDTIPANPFTIPFVPASNTRDIPFLPAFPEGYDSTEFMNITKTEAESFTSQWKSHDIDPKPVTTYNKQRSDTMKPDETHPVTSVDAYIDYNVTKVPSPKDSDHINDIKSSNSIDADHKKSRDESEDITGFTITKSTSTESTLNGHLVQQVQDENDRYSQRLNDIKETHQRQMRELRDELNIAQHRSNSAYATEKQMKRHQQRLEAMNDLNADLAKTQDLLSQQCQETEELKERLKVIPNLKQQIEQYKSQMIHQVTRKMASLEEVVTKLRHENDELKLHLKTSRKEVINLQS